VSPAPPHARYPYATLYRANYYGRADAADSGARLPRRFTATKDAHAPLPAVIDINAVLTDSGLEVTWDYAGRLLDADDVGELAGLWTAALRALVGHAATPDAGGRSPSDFDLVTVTQAQIDDGERHYHDLVDV